MTIRNLHSEKSLIKSCKSGDPKAQKELYDRYASKMLFVAKRYMGDDYEAQEVLLAAFLKVFQQLNQFELRGSFEGWIRRIVVREAIDKLRKRKFVTVAIDQLQISEYEEDLSVEVAYSKGELMHALSQLSEGYRSVFNMYVIEEYKHKEIAEMLGISLSTSKTQLLRAKKQLRELLIKNKTNGEAIGGSTL